MLGPILFLLFVNDMPEGTNSFIQLFADDTKILRKVSSEEDRDILQEDLDKLCEWSDRWLINKCKSMHAIVGNRKMKELIV